MNVEALKELAAKVEVNFFDGEPPKFNSFCDEWEAIFGIYVHPTYSNPWRAYNGDLNAAKALHDAVLPGWAWSVKTLATDSVQVWTNRAYGLREPGHIGTTKDNPARAWLLAILRALIAQEEGK